jgi:hypothetical protein
MTTFKELQQELRNKERSVTDLIRFVKTRADKNPNYSLFLGAGCSITSDVKSATELIKQWKKDIYISENDIEIEDYDENSVEDFFLKKMWYDSRNPYSALFEKKYDLPRQRRMFVEQEVRDKIPSIGYSYLIKLVENNYFKTLFTTNFDDLLNESFYQYSTNRPILCAHDSAINSITITSKRPKIIKLHGDYLFDDIKSTLRETESLEENIKNKFIEFAKDYGLIIIGYGGNDRSIVDILSYLLKNEEYFKNGIYWCLREDTEINEDLRKLLWKDRVYYVKIEGFDELMSEMNYKLNNNILPIDSSFLNEKKNKTIEQLISNPYLKNTNSKYIINDFKKLNDTKEKDIVSSFLKYVNAKDDPNEKNNEGFILKDEINIAITNEEQEFLIEIQQELFSNNYGLACELINKKLKNTNANSQFYINLIEKKANCLRKLNKIPQSIEQYKILIAKEPNRISLYLNLTNLIDDTTEKIKLLDKAELIEPYFYRIYNKKIEILYQKYVNGIDKIDDDLKQILDIISKSTTVNPAIINNSWMRKFDVLKKLNKDIQVYIPIHEELLNSLEIQDKYHPNIIKKKIELFELKKEKPEFIIKYILESINNTNQIEWKKFNELSLLNYYSNSNNIDKIQERINYIEQTYIYDDEYLYEKASLELEKLNNIDSAIETLLRIKNKTKKVYQRLFTYYLYQEKFESAQEILVNNLNNDEEAQETFYTAKQDFKKSLSIIQILLLKNPGNYNLSLTESYLLLKTGDFQTAQNHLKKYLTSSNYTDPHLLINYYIASKKIKGNIKEDKVKEKLITGVNDDLILAAAYAILNDSKNTYLKLSSAIRDNYSRRYNIKDWIVFEEMFKIEKIKKLLE